MLQNIVASIDTKEASKLLERATRLLNSDDGHKLSLKQLLGMISCKKSLITIFGHKHESKISMAFGFWFIFGIKLRILNENYINND